MINLDDLQPVNIVDSVLSDKLVKEYVEIHSDIKKLQKVALKYEGIPLAIPLDFLYDLRNENIKAQNKLITKIPKQEAP